MKTTWDYTQLASHYLKRPDYAREAIDRLCHISGVQIGSFVCDIGAGSGHLTKLLLDRGFIVTAVEPNRAMREVGESVTADRGVVWIEGTGEDTGQPDHAFDLVTFGSSFNTTDRPAALKESARILKPLGWFGCLWNHRDLSDPMQQEVEDYIKSCIADYGYGTRREDQTSMILQSGLFEPPSFIESCYTTQIAEEDYVEAWRSHATLAKQAGPDFTGIIAGIDRIVASWGPVLSVGYTTRVWMARRR